MKYNGIFNLVIGSTGLILGLLDIFLLDKSRILIVLYIIMYSSCVSNSKNIY